MKPNRKDKSFFSNQWELVSKENTKLKEEIEELKDRLDRSLKSKLDLTEIALNNSKENSRLKEQVKELGIEKALNILRLKIGTPIVKHFEGFINLAQSERDFKGKRNKISRGETLGFYTVEEVLKRH